MNEDQIKFYRELLSTNIATYKKQLDKAKTPAAGIYWQSAIDTTEENLKYFNQTIEKVK